MMRLLLVSLMFVTSCSACGRRTPHSHANDTTTTTSAATTRQTMAPTRPAAVAPSRPMSFSEAKRELRRLYQQGEQHSLYAGCPFNRWKLDWSRCCFEPQRTERKRLEWEHVVPAAAFGRGYREWHDGHPNCVKRDKPFRGRKCARRTSESFRHAEGDMHNLVPVIGEIYEKRGHVPAGLIDGEPRRFGSCDVEITTVFEPRPAVRGEVARAYLYMAAVYDTFSLDRAQRAMMTRWHRDDPPSSWERRRNDFIEQAQGNRNPWVDGAVP